MKFELQPDETEEGFRADVIVVQHASLLSCASILRPLECLARLDTPVSAFVQLIRHANEALDLSGLPISVDRTLDDYLNMFEREKQPNIVFLVCGLDVPAELRVSLNSLVRACSRYKIPLAAIGAATWALADSGVLDGKSCVVHWSSDLAFAERNIAIEVKPKLYRSEGRFATCAGETATLDFVISLLGESLGGDVAKQICNRLLVAYPRSADTTQPGAQENRLQHFPPLLQRIVRDMCANIESPLSVEALANRHQLSRRQVERVFASNVGISPRKYYRALQAEAAYQLCQQTEMPIVEISVACGFGSPSTLSRIFRAKYGMTPRQLRVQRAHLPS